MRACLHLIVQRQNKFALIGKGLSLKQKGKAIKLSDSFGPLAQSVEHRTFNAMVPRSSRGRPTKQNERSALISPT